MADKDLTFHLKTTGDPKGAKAVERAIDDAADAARSLGSSRSGGTNAFERNLRESATAAQSTEAAVEELERSIGQLNEEIAKNKSLTTDQVANLKVVTSGGERLVRIQREQRTTAEAGAKSTRSYGLAALEASRAFEDMQYGVRGVLNNIPQLVMMLGGSAGLTAAISIAAVAATQLWERFVSGPKEAEKATEDWIETLNKAKRVFEDMESAGIDAQAERIADRARGLAAELSSIDFESRRGAAGETAEARRIESERLVALARNKLEIAQTEAALLKASAEEALKLAERRKQLASEVASIELEALERRRELEADKASRDLATAQRRSEAIKESEDAAQKEQNQVVAEQSEMRDQAERLTRERFNLVDAMREEIDTLRQEIRDISEGNKYNPSPTAAADAIDQIEAKIEAKYRVIDSSNAPSGQEVNSYAAAEAMQKRVDVATAELNNISDEQRKASQAIRDAALALKSLRDAQSIDRGGEQQVRDIEKQIEVVKGPDQSAAVNAIGNVADQLEGTNLAGIAEQLKGFVSDKALTADELTKAQVLLNQYFGRIANLGASQNTIIREALVKVDDLEREVRTLRNNQSNAVPSN